MKTCIDCGLNNDSEFKKCADCRLRIREQDKRNKPAKPSLDQLLAENDSLRFKICRLEKQLKYHWEFFNIMNEAGLDLPSRGWELYDLLNDLQEYGI